MMQRCSPETPWITRHCMQRMQRWSMGQTRQCGVRSTTGVRRRLLRLLAIGSSSSSSS